MARRKIVVRVLWATSLALQAWLLVGIVGHTLYERAEVRIPAYPNAANLRTTPLPYGPAGAGFTSLTTFETADSTEAVLAFYRAQLTPRGLQHWDVYVGSDSTALFTRDGCPSHLLTLQSGGSPPGLTTVRLNHSAITRC